MPEYTLYRSDGSCSFVPHAVFQHVGIPITSVRMQLGPDGYAPADSSLTPAAYRATVHPQGYVPALSVDGQVVTEVPAILQYISSLAPALNLTGDAGLPRARVAEWLSLLSGTLHGSGFALLWRPGRFSDDAAAHDAIRAKGRAVINDTFARIDRLLEDKEFSVGGALTVADFYLYVFARWGKTIGMDMEAAYPSYSALARRMEAVDGVRKAIEAEGLDYRYE